MNVLLKEFNKTGCVKIGRSEPKHVFSLLLLMGFFAFGIYLVYIVITESFPTILDRIMLLVIAIVWILLFGFVIFIILRNKKDIGIVIDRNGIDADNAFVRAKIAWNMIAEIRVAKINIYRGYYQKAIVPILKGKDTKQMKAIPLFRMNIEKYGSPFVISASGLNCSFRTLKKIIDAGYEKYGNI